MEMVTEMEMVRVVGPDISRCNPLPAWSPGSSSLDFHQLLAAALTLMCNMQIRNNPLIRGGGEIAFMKKTYPIISARASHLAITARRYWLSFTKPVPLIEVNCANSPSTYHPYRGLDLSRVSSKTAQSAFCQRANPLTHCPPAHSQIMNLRNTCFIIRKYIQQCLRNT